jgi:nucleoid-associated protein YgaU
MQCQDARRLLHKGLQPGSTASLCVTLGFHLASCPACRAHRRRMEEYQLLATLLAEPLRPNVPPRPARTLPQRNHTVLRAASAALLVGSALAFVPAPKAPTVAAAPARVVAASPVQRSAQAAVHRAEMLRAAVHRAAVHRAEMLRLERQAPAASQRADDALLMQLLAEPVPAQAAQIDARALTALPVGAQLAVPVVATAPQQQTTPGQYVVAAGDNLFNIAQRLYGNGNYWTLLYNANVTAIGDNPSLIFSGTRLSVPPLGATTQPPQTGQGANPNRTYTIVSGDTLSAIALRVYGDANQWPRIYNANVGVLGNNPNLIYPGTTITLP